MKRVIEYILLFSLIMFFGIYAVYAEECDSTELAKLKIEADNIDITYELVDDLVDENDNKLDDYFLVTFSNISEDYFFTEVDVETKKRKIYSLTGQIENGKYSIIVRNPGQYNYEIYSEQCGSKVRTIKTNISKKNTYASDPLCKGHEDLDVCSEEYNSSELTTEEFTKIIEDATKKENEEVSQVEEDSTDNIEEKKNNVVFTFLKNNYLYFIGAFVVILIFIIYKIINKKRGLLE